jgi:hypothetical protein
VTDISQMTAGSGASTVQTVCRSWESDAMVRAMAAPLAATAP